MYDIKGFATEFKADVDKREIEGYATIFGNRDLGGDVMLEGFFEKSIEERMPKGLIKTLWNHSHSWPLGKPTYLKEDSTGLAFKTTIARTSYGDDALILIKEGVVDRMSIGYDTVRERWEDRDGKSTRLLEEGTLWEISPVTFAMNEGTSIAALKSARVFHEAMHGGSVDHLDMDQLQKAIDVLQGIYDTVSVEAKKHAQGVASELVSEEAKSAICELGDIMGELNTYAKERTQ